MDIFPIPSEKGLKKTPWYVSSEIIFATRNPIPVKFPKKIVHPSIDTSAFLLAHQTLQFDAQQGQSSFPLQVRHSRSWSFWLEPRSIVSHWFRLGLEFGMIFFSWICFCLVDFKRFRKMVKSKATKCWVWMMCSMILDVFSKATSDLKKNSPTKNSNHQKIPLQPKKDGFGFYWCEFQSANGFSQWFSIFSPPPSFDLSNFRVRWTGIITLYYQPEQCIIIMEITQNYRTFALNDPWWNSLQIRTRTWDHF